MDLENTGDSTLHPQKIRRPNSSEYYTHRSANSRCEWHHEYNGPFWNGMRKIERLTNADLTPRVITLSLRSSECGFSKEEECQTRSKTTVRLLVTRQRSLDQSTPTQSVAPQSSPQSSASSEYDGQGFAQALLPSACGLSTQDPPASTILLRITELEWILFPFGGDLPTGSFSSLTDQWLGASRAVATWEYNSK